MISSVSDFVDGLERLLRSFSDGLRCDENDSFESFLVDTDPDRAPQVGIELTIKPMSIKDDHIGEFSLRECQSNPIHDEPVGILSDSPGQSGIEIIKMLKKFWGLLSVDAFKNSFAMLVGIGAPCFRRAPPAMRGSVGYTLKPIEHRWIPEKEGQMDEQLGEKSRGKAPTAELSVDNPVRFLTLPQRVECGDLYENKNSARENSLLWSHATNRIGTEKGRRRLRPL
jgi:hypothetical protein